MEINKLINKIFGIKSEVSMKDTIKAYNIKDTQNLLRILNRVEVCDMMMLIVFLLNEKYEYHEANKVMKERLKLIKGVR